MTAELDCGKKAWAALNPRPQAHRAPTLTIWPKELPLEKVAGLRHQWSIAGLSLPK